MGNAHASIIPYQVVRVQDGYITIAVGSEFLWKRFCAVLGVQETVGADARFASNGLRNENRGALWAALQPVFDQRGGDEWLAALREADIPCGRINSLEQALEDPQLRARGMVAEVPHPLLGAVRTIGNPIKLGASPVSYRRPPPLLGEHSAEILRELGYSESDVADFRARGVI